MSETLYRNFTSASEIDKQYDVEATVPDFGEYVAYFVKNSEYARNNLKCTLDIHYGPTRDETLDIFYPSKEQDSKLRPAVFFIHGGYWKATTSKEWSYIARALADLGIVTAVENYALCPKVSVAEIVRQHRAAFSYFWNNAESLGVDRNQIMIVGHSVGGHGVAQLLSSDWQNEYDMPATPYIAAIAVSGLFDVRPIPHTTANPILKITPENAISLTPVLTADHGKVPLLVTVGSNETTEFLRQSKDFAAACEQSEWQVSSAILERNHFNILDEFIHGEGVMIDFIKHHLKI
ncbi:alpha/beta hydrolase [Shewanella dokdonensis]|uniref:Alpha/beta hydrolase n=1 Tax=Shewanella dokdonensis TaxID=712036 RepID=A0ABX8DGY2_9GAMM|nr:alpha/beta hydrolase [Shewanella dokdonensis]MCL1073864.1 alpha/beta hydrolase [Shewanella dokdonensis]QVK23645.1 alpha/beta hydrolase [Shewanella dokdonensis]